MRKHPPKKKMYIELLRPHDTASHREHTGVSSNSELEPKNDGAGDYYTEYPREPRPFLPHDRGPSLSR